MHSSQRVLSPTCVAKQKEQHHFRKGVPPPWWPLAVLFDVFTSKTQGDLVALLTDLLDYAKVKAGLLDDLKRALRRKRNHQVLVNLLVCHPHVAAALELCPACAQLA